MSGSNLPQNSYEPSHTFKKLHCQKDPNQFSGYYITRLQTDIHPILICLSFIEILCIRHWKVLIYFQGEEYISLISQEKLPFDMYFPTTYFFFIELNSIVVETNYKCVDLYSPNFIKEPPAKTRCFLINYWLQ